MVTFKHRTGVLLLVLTPAWPLRSPLRMSAKVAIGVDVGTGSARAGVVVATVGERRRLPRAAEQEGVALSPSHSKRSPSNFSDVLDDLDQGPKPVIIGQNFLRHDRWPLTASSTQESTRTGFTVRRLQ